MNSRLILINTSTNVSPNLEVLKLYLKRQNKTTLFMKKIPDGSKSVNQKIA